MSPISVVIATGGTAGHIEPALSVAEALTAFDPQVHVTFLGSRRGLESRLVPERGFPLVVVDAAPMPRGVGRDTLKRLRDIRRAARQAERILRDVHPDVVVGFGGYASAPAYMAARRRHIPVVIHEANSRPGLANRLGARRAARVLTSSIIPWSGAHYVPLPLRRGIATLDRSARRAAARAALNLTPDGPVLLVFGGSQGARRINEALADALEALTRAGVQVLHLHGTANAAISYAGGGYRPMTYLEEMEQAYAAADLAVCRAGAMTCGELAAVGLPAVFVPLPVGNGEQRLNALPMVEAGGGVLVEDADLSGEKLTEIVLPLIGDAPRLSAMAQAAYALGARDGDRVVAQHVLDVIGMETTRKGER